jgi:proton glutamate symport protein
MAGHRAGHVAVTAPPPRASYRPAVWVLIGLGAGLLLGIFASSSGSPALLALVRGLEPVGIIFVNAIRMTVVPLVVAMLISGIVSVTDAGLLSRLGLKSLLLGLGLAFTVALFTMVIAVPVLARLPVDPAAAAALRQGITADSASPLGAPSLGQWLIDLVPANVFKAAADGSMLPLIVFTLAFGFALTRVPASRKATVAGFFSGLADAMMVLVGWIIRLAPIGVLALAAPLASRMGAGVAGALLSYVLLAVVLTIAALALIIYPVTVVAGGVSVARLARACAPAQALALSSRSTMASLPAMITAARTLGVPESIVAFVVPLAASMLRVGSAVGQTVAVLFAARLFDVTLSPVQLLAVLITTVATTFTAPGIPGGSIVVMVPILAAAGVPAGAVGILLGADVIPDMFRTMANVTGGISAAVLVGRAREGPALRDRYGNAE